jgi:PLD-like domain
MRATLRIFGALSLLVTAVSTQACAAPSEDDADSSEGAATLNDPYVGDGVIAALTQAHAGDRDKSWGESSDNVLPADFLQQIPPPDSWGKSTLANAETCKAGDAGCDADFLLKTCASQNDCKAAGVCTKLEASIAHPGEKAKSFCAGHSDRFLDQMYGIIAHGKRFVDVTSLTPPDGRFEAAVRNAITFATDSVPSIEIRLMFGNFPGEFLATKTVMKSLTRDVREGSKAKVIVGAYRQGLLSWNHSKIVAADGEIALVGGINMWTPHYLDKDPVHDMSMKVQGGAAVDAHVFANQIWDFACKDSGFLSIETLISSYPNASTACHPRFAATKKKTAGTRIVSVGRLGAIGNNPADTAIVAMIDTAKKTIRLSQQDLGPPKKVGVSLTAWPEDVMVALLAAMGRGVEVDLALSNLNATPGSVSPLTTSYSNGWSLGDVAAKLKSLGDKHGDVLPAGTDVEALICKKLHLVNLRSSARSDWPDGRKLASHAKLLVVDDRAFYLGSQNLYIANLAEHGFIVDDEAATKRVLKEYYEPMWSFSKSTLASGSDAASCVLSSSK